MRASKVKDRLESQENIAVPKEISYRILKHEKYALEAVFLLRKRYFWCLKCLPNFNGNEKTKTFKSKGHSNFSILSLYLQTVSQALN